MSSPAQSKVHTLLPVVVALVAGVLLFMAVRLEEIAAVRAATLYVFGMATGWFIFRFQDAMTEEGWPGLETHWGGLGGGLGGWRVSPAVIYLVGALAFGGILAWSVPRVVQVPIEVPAGPDDWTDEIYPEAPPEEATPEPATPTETPTPADAVLPIEGTPLPATAAPATAAPATATPPAEGP